MTILRNPLRLNQGEVREAGFVRAQQWIVTGGRISAARVAERDLSVHESADGHARRLECGAGAEEMKTVVWAPPNSWSHSRSWPSGRPNGCQDVVLWDQ
jgi:hypothetical protein